jgi:hypothetical protein
VPNFATESTLRYFNDEATVLQQLDCFGSGTLADL